MSLPGKTYIVVLIGSLAWCSLIFIAPYLATSDAMLANLMYQFFHPICHQLPERSFHLFGEKLAVCSRCSSVYFAFLSVVVVYPFVRSLNSSVIPHRNILICALLPMVIDVCLDFLGVHDSTFMTRALTGVVFGSVAAFFVLPAAIEAVQQIAAKRYSSSTI